MRVPAGFDPYYHRLLQTFVENPCFLGMQQPALDQLACFLVQHCNLLKARMKVTAYILHIRPPSSRALRSCTSSLLETVWGPLSSYNQPQRHGENCCPENLWR